MAYNQPQNPRYGQSRQTGGRSREYSQFDAPPYEPTDYETQERWNQNRDFRQDEGYRSDADYSPDQDYELGGSERDWEHGGRESWTQRSSGRGRSGSGQQHAQARTPYGQGSPYNQNAWSQQQYRQQHLGQPPNWRQGEWRQDQQYGSPYYSSRAGQHYGRDSGGAQYFGGGQSGYGQGYNEDHFTGSAGGFPGSRGNPYSWSQYGAHQPQGASPGWQNEPSRHDADYSHYGNTSGRDYEWSRGERDQGFRGEGMHSDTQQGYRSQSFSRGRPPKGYERSDERIREDVCECLTHDSIVDASEVTVTVKSGVVTLEGSVQERMQKYRVEDLADKVSGVKDVQNRLNVTRSQGAMLQGSGSLEGRGSGSDVTRDPQKQTRQ